MTPAQAFPWHRLYHNAPGSKGRRNAKDQRDQRVAGLGIAQLSDTQPLHLLQGLWVAHR